MLSPKLAKIKAKENLYFGMPIFIKSQCKNGALVCSIQYYLRNMRNIGIYVFICSYLSRKPDGASPQAIEPEHKKRRNPEGLRLFKYLIYFDIWLRGRATAVTCTLIL